MHEMKKLKKTIIYALALCGVLICVFPLIYMLANSFMKPDEITGNYGMLNFIASADSTRKDYASMALIPQKVTAIQYYHLLLRKPKFLIMFWNSVIMTTPIVAGQIVFSTLAAFGFSKLKFRFRDQIFFVYIIVMMMPFQVTLVPNYLVLNKLNIMGNYLAVILPGIFSTFGVFLMRQFMRSLPDEYIEAAKIDGAGYPGIFAKIVVPQCKSGIASLAILVFIDYWNMVEQPLIFLKNENMHPLSIFLSKINEGNLDVAFACGVLYMLPAVLLFLYCENYFIEGIQLSGIK